MYRFLFVIVLVLPFRSQAQGQSEVRAYYGIAESFLYYTSTLEGTGSTDVTQFGEFGVRYIYHTNKRLSYEVGINYMTTRVALTPTPTGQLVTEIRAETLEIMSVPLFVHYSLGNYFFVNGGPMLDFQLSENTVDSQSGIGLGLGFGAAINLGELSLFVNPNIRSHAVIPTQKERYQNRLAAFGLQFGVGYTFK